MRGFSIVSILWISTLTIVTCLKLLGTPAWPLLARAEFSFGADVSSSLKTRAIKAADKAAIRYPTGAGESNEKAKITSMQPISKVTETREAAAPNGLPAKSSIAVQQNGSKNTGLSKTEPSIRGKIESSVQATKRKERVSKVPIVDQESQLCKRGKISCSRKIDKPRRTKTSLGRRIRRSGSQELGKMRSFWQKNPGVLPPACLTAGGVIISACASIANAVHPSHANNIVAAAGSGITAGALVYGVIAGYNGHQSKERISPQQLEELGSSFTGQIVQKPINGYRRISNCVGNACRALGIIRKKDASENTSGSSRVEPSLEKTKSAPKEMEALPRHRISLENPRQGDDIELTESGNLQLRPLSDQADQSSNGRVGSRRTKLRALGKSLTTQMRDGDTTDIETGPRNSVS